MCDLILGWKNFHSSSGNAALVFSILANQHGILDALQHVCEDVGCIENQREAAALWCALAVPHENKLPLAKSESAEPLMLICQSSDVEVVWVSSVADIGNYICQGTCTSIWTVELSLLLADHFDRSISGFTNGFCIHGTDMMMNLFRQVLIVFVSFRCL